MRPDPRTAITVTLLAAAAALASSRGAAVALAALGLEAALARLELRALLLRLVPLASGFSLFLLLLPLAPRPLLEVTLRGWAAGAAVVLLGALASWSEVVGVLQGLGLPRTAVAFLVILARHTCGVAEEAHRAHHALSTRGGYDRPRTLGRATAVLLARVLFRALQRADQVARALELRGFQGCIPSLPRWRVRRAEAPHYALAAALLLAVVLEAMPWSR